MTTTTTSSPSTVIAVTEPTFTNAERLILARFLAAARRLRCWSYVTRNRSVLPA